MFNSLYASLPDYVSIERRKVKWARIEVAPDGNVRLIAPRRMRRGQMLELLRKRQDWITQKRARFQAIAETFPTLADNQVLLWGDIYTLCCESTLKRASIDRDNRLVHCPEAFANPVKFEQWQRKLAADYLRQRLQVLATNQGFTYNQVSIRNQKTRWGSCSSKNNISLNWRLIKAPVAVSDYVITHELVHTQIMNHSPAFWAEVEIHFPRFNDARQWLADFGHTL